MTDFTHGTPGASARREHERRHAQDQGRRQERFGRAAGLVHFIFGERQTTQAWDTGALGEENVGAMLNGIASPQIRVIHDQKLPGKRANIDHLVVTPSRVWVVDSKNYTGRPHLESEGGLFSERVTKLIVGGRNQTRLIDGMEAQIERVQTVVGSAPVVGVLCFYDANWPLIGGDFTFRNIHVVWPKLLKKLILKDEPAQLDVEATTHLILESFVAA